MKNRKKVFIIVLIAIIIICSLLFGFIKFLNPSMKAVVIKTNENSLMVMNIKDNSPYYIDTSNINAQFKPGQEVLIFYRYDTIIELTYPANIRNDYVKNIKILKEKSNINIPNKLLELTNVSKQEKDLFNGQFESYTGINISGSNVKMLLKKIMNNNTEKSDRQISVTTNAIQNHNSVSLGPNFGTIDTDNKSKILTNQSLSLISSTKTYIVESYDENNDGVIDRINICECIDK